MDITFVRAEKIGFAVSQRPRDYEYPEFVFVDDQGNRVSPADFGDGVKIVNPDGYVLVGTHIALRCAIQEADDGYEGELRQELVELKRNKHKRGVALKLLREQMKGLSFAVKGALRIAGDYNVVKIWLVGIDEVIEKSYNWILSFYFEPEWDYTWVENRAEIPKDDTEEIKQYAKYLREKLDKLRARYQQIRDDGNYYEAWGPYALAIAKNYGLCVKAWLEKTKEG